MNAFNAVMIRRLCSFCLVAALSTGINACDDEDLGPKATLLTVNIQADYFPGEFDVWMFISNNNGSPIDVRQVNDSTAVKFTGTTQTSLTLTIFTAYTQPSSNTGTWTSFSLESFQQLEPGAIITLEHSTSNHLQIPEVLGTSAFALHNYDDSGKPQDALSFTDGVSLPYTILTYNNITYSQNTFSAQLNVRKDPSRMLITTYRDDLPVYQWLENVKPGVPIEADYNLFMPSKTISVNKQIGYGFVKSDDGAHEALGYALCDLHARQISASSNLSQLPKLGYIDGFQKYSVNVALNPLHEEKNVYYSKRGTIPQSINLPDFPLSLINDHLSGVSLTSTAKYTYKQAFFTQSTPEAQLSWSLHSGQQEFKTPSVPGAIKGHYPKLPLDDVRLTIANYTDCLDGYTYQERINDLLQERSRTEFEEFRYSLRQ